MRDGGSVVLIGSIAGYVGIPGYSTYSATKAPCVPTPVPGHANSPIAASASTR